MPPRAVPLLLTPVLTACLLLIGSPAAAQEDDELGGIDEIIVTITKREEALQDVAAAVTVFGAEMIQEASIESMGDFVALMPNVTNKNANMGAITIRGISQGFLQAQSPTSQHLNGVFRFNDANSFSYGGQFYDIAGIEIVRGPAGTVYGRNATAGALNVRWVEPHAATEYKGDFTVGNYDLYQFRGVANIPFFGEGDERLMGRFVVTRERRDGYQDILNHPDTDDPGNADDWAARFTLKSVLSEDLEVIFRGNFVHAESGGFISKPLNATLPQGGVGVYDGLVPLQEIFLAGVFAGLGLPPPPTPLSPILQAVAQDFLLNGVPGLFDPIIGDPEAFTPALPVPGSPRMLRSRALDFADPGHQVYSVDTQISWDLHALPLLGDVSLIAIGGWEHARVDQVVDTDGTELRILDTYIQDRNDLYTAEVRLVSQNDTAVDWIAGVFFFNYEADMDILTITPFTFPGTPYTHSHRDVRGWAPFGSATVRIFDLVGWEDGPNVELFGGLRWNWDRIKSRTESDPPVKGDDVFRERTGEIGVRWFWGEDNMLYLKRARGYKSGLIEFFADGSQNSVDSEVVEATELGSRNVLLDGNLILNLTAFYYEYSNLQVPILRGREAGGLEIRFENAAEATIWGVELEAVIQPVPEWTTQISVGYMQSEYDDFCTDDPAQDFTISEPGCETALDPATGLPPSGSGASNLSGNELEDAPQLTVALVSRYEFSLGDWGTLTPVAEFSWQEEYFIRPFNQDVDDVGDYTKTDLRLIWRSPEQMWTVEAFVQNLNETYPFVRNVVGPEVFGALSAGFAGQRPRTYGLRVGFEWGPG